MSTTAPPRPRPSPALHLPALFPMMLFSSFFLFCSMCRASKRCSISCGRFLYGLCAGSSGKPSTRRNNQQPHPQPLPPPPPLMLPQPLPPPPPLLLPPLPPPPLPLPLPHHQQQQRWQQHQWQQHQRQQHQRKEEDKTATDTRRRRQEVELLPRQVLFRTSSPEPT